MQVKISEHHEAMSRMALDMLIQILEETLIKKDHAVFMPSAGKTPTVLYNLLHEYKNKINWQKIIIIQMDEYIGNFHDEFSFKSYLLTNLINPLGISNFISLPKMSCPFTANIYMKNYEKIIRDIGGIDVALHGIGTNGHIGFNEPGCLEDQSSGVFALAASTILANKEAFKGQACPTHGCSLGLNILAEARKNILIASGTSKKIVVKNLIKTKIFSNTISASILVSKNTTLFTEKICLES